MGHPNAEKKELCSSKNRIEEEYLRVEEDFKWENKQTTMISYYYHYEIFLLSSIILED